MNILRVMSSLVVLAYVSVASAHPSATVKSISCTGSGRLQVHYALSGGPAVVTVDFLTNGVSIGAQNFSNVDGDVNKLVQDDDDLVITWKARALWPDHRIDDKSFGAALTAWAVSAPPDYMVVGIDKTEGNDVRYYASADALPDGGLTNNVYRTDRIVMRRIHARGAQFRMGTKAETGIDTSSEVPHRVTLTEDYYLGVFEVTQRQYERIWGSTPSTFTEGADAPLRPVNKVCYRHVRGGQGNFVWPTDGHKVSDSRFLGKLRTRTGVDFDLPTMAQWEFAGRAGVGAKFNNGSEVWSDDLGWNAETSPVNGVPQTHPVGIRTPNAWGLYDMHGNVTELCLDWARVDNAWKWPTDEEVTDPAGPETTNPADYGCYRGTCGSHYLSTVANSRITAHGAIEPWVNSDQYADEPWNGFRLWCPVTAK